MTTRYEAVFVVHETGHILFKIQDATEELTKKFLVDSLGLPTGQVEVLFERLVRFGVEIIQGTGRYDGVEIEVHLTSYPQHPERNEVVRMIEPEMLVEYPGKNLFVKMSPPKLDEKEKGVSEKKIGTVEELCEAIRQNRSAISALVHTGDRNAPSGRMVHMSMTGNTKAVSRDSLEVRYTIFIDDLKKGKQILHTTVEHGGLDNILKHMLGHGSPVRRRFFRTLADGNHHVALGRGSKRDIRLEAMRTEL